MPRRLLDSRRILQLRTVDGLSRMIRTLMVIALVSSGTAFVLERGLGVLFEPFPPNLFLNHAGMERVLTIGLFVAEHVTLMAALLFYVLLVPWLMRANENGRLLGARTLTIPPKSTGWWLLLGPLIGALLLAGGHLLDVLFDVQSRIFGFSAAFGVLAVWLIFITPINVFRQTWKVAKNPLTWERQSSFFVIMMFVVVYGSGLIIQLLFSVALQDPMRQPPPSFTADLVSTIAAGAALWLLQHFVGVVTKRQNLQIAGALRHLSRSSGLVQGLA